MEFGKGGETHHPLVYGLCVVSSGWWALLRVVGAHLFLAGLDVMGSVFAFWCRRSQERVSVHPHRLHPSFDFGHQLQTPQPRYLAEGTDW